MSRPPRPPQRRGQKFATRALERKQKHLDDIRNGVPGAEEKYQDFLIEQGEYFYSLEEVLPADQIERIPQEEIIPTNHQHDGNKPKNYANAFVRTRAPEYLAQGGRERVPEYLTTSKAMMTNGLVASTDKPRTFN